MPASVVNIGGPTSGNTWAAVRAPIWKGTGWKEIGGTYEYQNWSRFTEDFSSGYPDAEGVGSKLCRAFPFKKATGTGVGYADMTSTPIGVNYTIEILPGPDARRINYYLALGSGAYYYAGFDVEWVTIGYNLPNGGDGPASSPYPVGYDMPSMRSHLVGTTVNVKLKNPETNSFFNYSVAITLANVEQLLPDNQEKTVDNPYFADVNVGIYIASINFTAGFPDPDFPLWEVVSISWD